MANTGTTAVRPFGMRDKIGYMFGDFGNDFTFMLSSSFMMVFYTDIMGVPSVIVGLLMMVARFVDAFTDVTMRQIIDYSKPTKDGRFRPWIKRMCGPVAIASFLIYQSEFAGMPMAFKVVWMFVTYLLWGSVFYTSINIPYGSMASAISPNADDRTQLSTYRSIGATLASLVIGTATPLVAYETVNGNPVLSGSRMLVVAGVFSVCAIVCYMLCFNLTTERIVIPPKTEKFSFVKLFKTVFTSRSLIGIILAAICLLLTMLTMSGMNPYIFPYYFRNTAAQSAVAMCSSFGTLLIAAPLAPKLSAKFGKKEISVVGSLVGAGLFLICYLVHPENAWVYLGFYTLAYIGMGLFNTVVWAMITDVIDDCEVRKGIREDGTIYSVYSFARKLGQAASAGLVGALLGIIGYTAETQFEPVVQSGIYTIACIAPVIGFVAIALVLLFVYPLDKKTVDNNVKILEARRAEKK